MKHFYLAALAALTAASASAGVFTPYGTPDRSKEQGAMRFLPTAERTFRAMPGRSLPEAFQQQKAVSEGTEITPDFTLEAPYNQNFSTVGDCYGPNGENWFYTLVPEGDIITQNEYFTDINWRSFKLTLYNERHQVIGQCADTLAFPQGAGKCQSMQVGLQVTKTFFNTNSTDYEVMIVANFNPEVGYGAKQFTYAYSLKPEGEATPCISCVPGLYVEAQNLGNKKVDNFLMVFIQDSTWDEDLAEAQGNAIFTIYKKASYGSQGANKVQDFTVDMKLSYSDGDNEVLPFCMTANGNEVYVTEALYEKSFLEDPSDPENDNMTPDNHYVIKLYKSNSNSFDLIKETSIACEDPDEGYFLRSYALGNFSGTGDITFDFGDYEGLPCYIISVVDTDLNEETTSYFAIYNPDGEEIRRFAEGADGYVELSDVPGQPKQYAFIMTDPQGNYGFCMYNYPSLEYVSTVPQLFEYDDQLWGLSSMLDRTAGEGGCVYAASANNGATDDDGQNIHRVVWFNHNGSVNHVDELRFGTDVAKVIPYISAPAMDPYLFNTSDEFEYIAWVYRYIEQGKSKTSLELVVCDNTGRILSTRKLPENNAYPMCYVMNTGSASPCLFISYRDIRESGFGGNNPMVGEFIDLPMNKFEGKGTVESPYLINTIGDFSAIRNNLTAHFRLTRDLDFGGRTLLPIEGSFTGALDGDGHTVKGFTLNSDLALNALFESIGEKPSYGGWGQPRRAYEGSVTQRAFIFNITLEGVTQSVNSFNSSAALLASGVYDADIYSLNIDNATVCGDDYRQGYALIANTLSGSNVGNCRIANADVNLPQANALGGVTASLATSKLSAIAVSGSLTARNNVAAIAAATSWQSESGEQASAVKDCHVNATLTADHTVGGIIADNANRTPVTRCLVEGTITANSPTTDWIDSGMITTFNAGGILGNLACDEIDPSVTVVKDCVVALDALNLSGEGIAAHRIIGKSQGDLGETTTYDDDWNPITHPAAQEAALANNYAWASLPQVEQGELLTEGTSVEASELTPAWFDSKVGFAVGTDIYTPWQAGPDCLMKLYIEGGETTGILAPSASTESALTFDGQTVALGNAAEIRVYTLDGRLVLSGNGRLSVASLPAGLYVAVAPATPALRFSKN